MTANTIVTFIVYSKLDYCYSLYFNLPKTQINRLQHIQNSLAKYSHITPVLKSLHWLKSSNAYNINWFLLLTKFSPPVNLRTYLHNVISLQTGNNTRSSDVTLARPSAASSLKITDRSFRYALRYLWNKFAFSLHEPVSPLYAYLNLSFYSPLSPSITASLFHSKLKSYLFGESFQP